MLISDPSFTVKDSVFFQKNFDANKFESAYVSIREKEGRLLNDAMVINLPDLPTSHRHSKEWKIRKESSERLIRYLKKTGASKHILEVGCGNGWLSNQFTEIPGADVVGLDINTIELKQAARVFSNKPNLTFVASSVFSLQPRYKFDYIILASSIQYFPDLRGLLLQLQQQLSNGGEVHILDSPLYNQESVLEAKVRSTKYFDSQHSSMNTHYHHHSWDALSSFNYTVPYDPKRTLTRIRNKFRTGSPFPWIIVKKV